MFVIRMLLIRKDKRYKLFKLPKFNALNLNVFNVVNQKTQKMESVLSILPPLDISSLLILTAIILLTVWLLDVRHRRHMPPGPFQWPFVGCLPQMVLNSKDSLGYLRALGQHYKGLFSLKLGSFHAVFISDYQTLKEAFVTQADCFSGRPHDFLPPNIMFQYKGTKGMLSLCLIIEWCKILYRKGKGSCR